MVYRCCSCGKCSAEDELVEKEIDLENEYGVGGFFPDHHYESIWVCPYCGDDDLEEVELTDEELAEILNNANQ